MIKVVNVVQAFNVGGIENVLLSYLRAFKDDTEVDYSVVVLQKNEGSDLDRFAADECLKIYYLNCERSKNSHYYIRKLHDTWVYNARLFFFLLKEKPDIVNTHNSRILKPIFQCIGLLKNKYVWLHTMHSDPYAVHESHIPYIRKAITEYGIKPLCLNETQFQKAKERYGIEKCQYVNNMIPLDKFHNILWKRNQIRRRMDIPEETHVVGAIGRLEEVKNYLFLLDIFQKVLFIRPDSRLVFVGDGSQRQVLQEKADSLEISDSVLFLGNQRNLENFYPIFDVVVITSHTEALPLVALEAQAAGLKCVVSNAVTPSSIFCNRVVKMDQTDTIDEWARQVANPSKWFPPVSKEEDFSEQRCVDIMKNLYLEVLEDK